MTDCCAVLLRGGKSRRMGEDKACLPWKDGLTFLQAVAGQLDFLQEKYLSVSSAACGTLPEDCFSGSLAFSEPSPENCFCAGTTVSDHTMSSLREMSSLRGGLTADWVVLPDRVPDCGPMGGIWTALSACSAEWALTASCDIPAVRRTLFWRLLEERAAGEFEIIYPMTPDGRMHLTCALYKKSAVPLLEQQILKGDYRLRSLLSLCSSRAVLIREPETVRMLANINTKEELQRFLPD